MTAQTSDAAAIEPELPARPSWRERVLERLQSRRGVWLIAAIGCALSLPTLAIGLSTDDHIIAQGVRDGVGVSAMFKITPELVASAQQTGTLSWWTNPQLSIHFFRPLASLLHIFEYRVYPNAAWAMHLVNVLLYAGIAALAWLLYRRFLPNHPRWAALAALLFVVDDAHATMIGWISARNTLLASVFALAALWFHAEARSGPRRALPALASAACVALALCSAEAGLSAFAYLLAYAIALDPGSTRARVASVLPALGVIAVWAIVYISGGYGAQGAGFYRELSSPLSTLAGGLADFPTWLCALLGPSATSATMVLPVAPVRLSFTVLLLPLVAALVLALARTRENLFFALGMLFCLPPLFTTLPQGRLLLLASFGAFGLLASFIATAKQDPRRFVRGTRLVLVALHLVIAPLLFVPSLNPNGPIENGARALVEAVPRRAPAQVVLLHLPFELLPMYARPLLNAESDRTLPRSIQQLYSGASPLVAYRLDARTLELYAERGWADRLVERVFASVDSLPRVDDERVVDGIRIRVVESTMDGRPQRVQFEFPDALESSDRLWLTWRGTGVEPWQPPAIGREEHLEPLAMFTSLKPF